MDLRTISYSINQTKLKTYIKMKTILLSIALLFAVSCKKNNTQPTQQDNSNTITTVHTIKTVSNIDNPNNLYLYINNVNKTPATTSYTVNENDFILVSGQNIDTTLILNIKIYQDNILVKDETTSNSGLYVTYTVN